MIFVTVGGQMPFDRLTRTVDEWAAARQRDDVFAQIGDTDYEPNHVRWTRFLTPKDFRKTMEQSDLVVAHAGMGTILTAREVATPVLVLPRRASAQETRNEHQLATARLLQNRGLVDVAWEETDLWAKLDSIKDRKPPSPAFEELDRLVTAVRRFVDGS